ncbi:MAG: hypothetical protein QME58_05640 [Bacteroidota bacterium]|nr:hypothetical protein [Bacteroidota bacterium]
MIEVPYFPNEYTSREFLPYGFVSSTRTYTEVLNQTDIFESVKSSYSLTFINNFNLLQKSYNFQNSEQVKRVIYDHYYIIKPLLNINEKVMNIFCNKVVEICLEFDEDPEENYEGLSVIIKTNLSPEDSLDLLDKFDEEIWFDIDVRVKKILSVMVRPV